MNHLLVYYFNFKFRFILGLYHVCDHIRRAIPRISDLKKELTKFPLKEVTYDMDFSSLHVKSLHELQTFTSIHQMLQVFIYIVFFPSLNRNQLIICNKLYQGIRQRPNRILTSNFFYSFLFIHLELKQIVSPIYFKSQILSLDKQILNLPNLL